MIDRLRLQYPDAKIIHMDEGKYFSDVLKNPAKYGLTNTIDSCYLGGYVFLKNMKGLAGLAQKS